MISFFVLFDAPLMVGPSELLHLPNSPILIAVGLFLIGIGIGPLSIYTVTEAIEGGMMKFPNEKTKVTDNVASIYCFGDAVSLIIFPIVGSALSESLSFERSQEIMPFLLLIVFIVSLISTVYDKRRERKLKGR